MELPDPDPNRLDFDRHRADLLRYFQARVDCPQTAQDLLQEAFLRVTQALDQGPLRHAKAYLYRIAANLLTDHYRARDRYRSLLYMLSQTDATQHEARTSERAAIATEELQTVLAALAELSPLCQRIFYLRRFEGLKEREVAERLGISMRTVEDNLHRALLHCRRRITDTNH